jgi:hypothetical protein
VDPAQAVALARSYYLSVSGNNGTLSPAAASQLFMALDYAVPQAVASYTAPGDPNVIPFAGLFVDVDQIVQAHNLRHAAVEEISPLDADGLLFVSDGGSVAVHYTLTGTARGGKKTPYNCSAVDYFQVFQAAPGLRIGRLTRFFDTYAVAMALK